MHIPQWPQAGEREAEMLRMVLESPQWGGFHPFVGEFEQRFAAFQGCAYGISGFNGTVTLELALAALGIGLGDEVIVPAISFISTATAVSRVGAVPVFVDMRRDTFNMDPQRVREAISPRTRMVMAVHFGSAMCDMDELGAICSKYRLLLFEDAAHAQGSEWNGKRAGSLGVAGSFSFQNGKVMTAGEGGILVTSDADFAEKARSLANCGRREGRSFYEHSLLGTNFRLTAFQAAVLLAQLERLPEQIRVRTSNTRLLKRLLADVPEIVWQQEPRESTQSSWYLLPGRLEKNFDGSIFRSELSGAGVPCAYYPHPLYQNPVYQAIECRVMDCPVAEASIRDSFWIPHRVLLADDETIRAVADAIRKAVRKARM